MSREDVSPHWLGVVAPVIYILLIFGMHGTVTPVEMSGQLACVQAKAAIVANGRLSIQDVMCIPKSVLLPVPDAKLRSNPAANGGRDR